EEECIAPGAVAALAPRCRGAGRRGRPGPGGRPPGADDGRTERGRESESESPRHSCASAAAIRPWTPPRCGPADYFGSQVRRVSIGPDPTNSASQPGHTLLCL